jgi:uncharacterized protein YjbJ (UPF0337 family)
MSCIKARIGSVKLKTFESQPLRFAKTVCGRLACAAAFERASTPRVDFNLTEPRASPPRCPDTSKHPKELYMDKEHVKGAADQVKGAIKDTAGKVTGDKELQTEGKVDKAKGAVHNAVGDAKDAVRKAGE